MLETIQKTHETLLHSEARFRDLTGHLPQIIFEMDTAGNIQYVNQAGEDQFGITGKMIGQGVNISRFYLRQYRTDATRFISSGFWAENGIHGTFTAEMGI